MAYINPVIPNTSSSCVFITHMQSMHIVEAKKNVTFSIEKNNEIVFTAKFVPDSKEEIHIHNLRDILENNIEGVFARFTFIAKEDNSGQYTRTYSVFKSAVRVSETADEFLPSFFLTTLINRKITQLKRYETLSFYTENKCNVYVVASYFNDNNIYTKEIELMSENDVKTRDINSVDVSPSRFVDDSIGNLTSFVVRAGERSFSFNVDATLPKSEPSIIFLNNFACWETMYLTGTVETELELKRSHAYIDGSYRIYDIDETELFKANSGILLDGMINLGKDLARSKSVFLLDSMGVASDEIVITDSEIKYTNDDDAMPTFEYTYRRASLVSAMIHTIRPPKLFDKTFDTTFN